jgi:hypothetical protein
VYEFFNRAEFIKSLAGTEKLAVGTPYNSKIASVDIAGDVAVAKVENDRHPPDDRPVKVEFCANWQLGQDLALANGITAPPKP